MGLSYLNHSITDASFFTYFSEFHRQREQAYIIWETVILTLMFTIGFIGNLLVISFIVRFPSMRQVTNFYITNLAVSDLIFGLTTPFVIATRITGEWLLGNHLCHFLVYTMYVCGITSVWTMVTISVDRYRSIVKFERDKSKFLKVFIRMAVIWVAAMLFALPIGLFFEELSLKLPETSNYQNVSVCTLNWENTTATIIYCTANFICVFCIPLIIIARNYHLIMETFNSSRRRMREYSQSTPHGSLQDSNPGPPRLRRMTSIGSIGTLREIRVMTMLVLMVTLFAIMWCPIVLIQFFLIMDWLHLQSWHFIATLGVTYLNVALNPIVYGLLNEQYRKQFVQVFQKMRCRCCTCDVYLCPTKGSFDLEMEDTNSLENRTPVVTVCARGLELAGDVALASNGITFSNHNFVNPAYIEDEG